MYTSDLESYSNSSTEISLPPSSVAVNQHDSGSNTSAMEMIYSNISSAINLQEFSLINDSSYGADGNIDTLGFVNGSAGGTTLSGPLGKAGSASTSGNVASMLVMAICATLTNGLLLMVLVVRRPLRTNPSNRLVMSLTFINLLLSLLVVPLFVVVSYTQPDQDTNQPFAPGSCFYCLHSNAHEGDEGTQQELAGEETTTRSGDLLVSSTYDASTGAVGEVLYGHEDSSGSREPTSSWLSTVASMATTSYGAKQTLFDNQWHGEVIGNGGEQGWVASSAAPLQEDQWRSVRKRSIRNVNLDLRLQSREEGYQSSSDIPSDNIDVVHQTFQGKDTVVTVRDLSRQEQLFLCKQRLLTYNTHDDDISSVLFCIEKMFPSFDEDSMCLANGKFKEMKFEEVKTLCWLVKKLREDEFRGSNDTDTLDLVKTQGVHPGSPNFTVVRIRGRRDTLASDAGRVQEPLDQVSGRVDKPLRHQDCPADFLCQLVSFVTNWLISSSSFTVAVIAADRYLSLRRPLAPSSGTDARGRCRILLAGCWGGGMLVALPPFFGWGRYAYRPDWGSCGVVWGDSLSYTATWLTVVVLLPLLLLTVCYIMILKMARNKCRKVNVGTMLNDAEMSNAAGHHGNHDHPATPPLRPAALSHGIELIGRVSPSMIRRKSLIRKNSIGESVSNSTTRKSSIVSGEWQLRRSYSNSSQLTPYSKTYLSSASQNLAGSNSTEHIARSCSSQLLPYSSLKNSCLSLTYEPKSENASNVSSKTTLYRPNSVHIEPSYDKEHKTERKKSPLATQRDRLEVNSKFLHPHGNLTRKTSTPNISENCGPRTTNSVDLQHRQIYSSQSCDEVPSLHGAKMVAGRLMLGPEKFRISEDKESSVGDLKSFHDGRPPMRSPLPKSGSECTLAVPASQRRLIGVRTAAVRRSVSDAAAVRKSSSPATQSAEDGNREDLLDILNGSENNLRRHPSRFPSSADWPATNLLSLGYTRQSLQRGSRCSRTHSLLSWSPSLRVRLSRRTSQRNSWGWETSPGKGLRTVSVVVGLQLVTWLPYSCVVVLEMLGQQYDNRLLPFGMVKWSVTALLFSACVLQPLVYGLLNRLIRKQGRALIGYHSRRRLHVPAKCLWFTTLYTLLLRKLTGNTTDPLKLSVNRGCGSSRSSHNGDGYFSPRVPTVSTIPVAGYKTSIRESHITAYKKDYDHAIAEETHQEPKSNQREKLNLMITEMKKEEKDCLKELEVPNSKDCPPKVLDFGLGGSPEPNEPLVHWPVIANKLNYRDRCHTVGAMIKARISYKKMSIDNSVCDEAGDTERVHDLLSLDPDQSAQQQLELSEKKDTVAFASEIDLTRNNSRLPEQPLSCSNYRNRSFTVGAKLKSNMFSRKNVSGDPEDSGSSIGSSNGVEGLKPKVISRKAIKQNFPQILHEYRLFNKKGRPSTAVPELFTIPATPPTLFYADPANNNNDDDMLCPPKSPETIKHTNVGEYFSYSDRYPSSREEHCSTYDNDSLPTYKDEDEIPKRGRASPEYLKPVFQTSAAIDIPGPRYLPSTSSSNDSISELSDSGLTEPSHILELSLDSSHSSICGLPPSQRISLQNQSTLDNVAKEDCNDSSIQALPSLEESVEEQNLSSDEEFAGTTARRRSDISRIPRLEEINRIAMSLSRDSVDSVATICERSDFGTLHRQQLVEANILINKRKSRHPSSKDVRGGARWDDQSGFGVVQGATKVRSSSEPPPSRC